MKKREPPLDETLEEKALGLQQHLKYAADIAELYESELAKSKELEAANRDLRREIAERLKLELELIESERRYRSLFEDSRDPILMTNRAGRIVEANSAFMKLLDYSEDEIIGQSVLKVCAKPPLRGVFRDEIEAAGSLKHFEVQLIKKDCSVIDCLMTASLRFDKDGRLSGYQAIIRDLTEEKRSEKLRQKADLMESVSRLVQVAADPLRASLAISFAAAQSLNRDGLSAQVLTGIKRAALIIENLLTFFEPVRENNITSIKILSLIRDAVNLISRTGEERRIRLNLRPENEAVMVNGNAQLLSQMLLNLLTVSLAYVGEGGAAEVSVNKSGPTVLIIVSNNSQTNWNDEVLTPSTTDLEFVLSVSHAIALQHGGCINFERPPGLGTIFEIVLPAQHSEPS